MGTIEREEKKKSKKRGEECKKEDERRRTSGAAVALPGALAEIVVIATFSPAMSLQLQTKSPILAGDYL